MPAAVAAAEAELGDRLAGEQGPRDTRRQLLADYYRRVGHYLDTLASRPVAGEVPPPPAADPQLAAQRDTLTPRTAQVLERLLEGDSEKQVALLLGISRHTVHDHVKTIHKTFGVVSRGELLARFINESSGPAGQVR